MSRVYEKLCSREEFYVLSLTHIARTLNMVEYTGLITFSTITGVFLLGAIVVAIKVCRDDRACILAARARTIRGRTGM